MANLPPLLDTSYLRRFTASGHERLLHAYPGAIVTQRVLSEHKGLIPHSAHTVLEAAIRKVPLVKRAWFDGTRTAAIVLRHPALSEVDASLLLIAKEHGHCLFTADRPLFDACIAEGVPVKHFVNVLLDLRQAGWITSQDELRQIVKDVHAKTGYPFNAAALKLLGL